MPLPLPLQTCSAARNRQAMPRVTTPRAHPQPGPSRVTAAHLDLLALQQLCFNENKPNSAKQLPSPNRSRFGESGWVSICTSSSWHRRAVRSSSFSSWQSIEQRGYENQAQKAIPASVPQQHKQKQLSFGKADVAFNSLTGRVRWYIFYFPQYMNAIEDILGTPKFCIYFVSEGSIQEKMHD